MISTTGKTRERHTHVHTYNTNPPPPPPIPHSLTHTRNSGAHFLFLFFFFPRSFFSFVFVSHPFVCEYPASRFERCLVGHLRRAFHRSSFLPSCFPGTPIYDRPSVRFPIPSGFSLHHVHPSLPHMHTNTPPPWLGGKKKRGPKSATHISLPVFEFLCHLSWLYRRSPVCDLI